MDVYKYEVTAEQHSTLFLALGCASGVAMKDGNSRLAQSFLALAADLSNQFRAQIGEEPDGKTDPADPNPLPTNGTD